MKKLLVFLISLFSFITITNAASAVNNVHFDIKHDFFDVTILGNGDAKVKELIVYDGSFNGINVELCSNNNNLNNDRYDFENSSIYNFNGIKDFKVSAKNISNPKFKDIFDTDYDEFEYGSFLTKGDRFKYNKEFSYDCDKYKIYHATHNNEVGFLMEYTLDDVVVVNNDVAEFYWQIFSPGAGREKIEDVKVKVHLPGKDSKDYFRIWTHDILDSEINYIDDYSGFIATAKKVSDDDNFDVRATFSKYLIYDDSTLDKRDIDGFDEILKVEEKRAEQANLIREELRKTYETYDKGGKVITVITLIFTAALLLKLKVKPRTDFYAKYYREFIEDYDVEVIDYLYHKKLTPNALSAAIMNLIYKKKVKVEEITNEKNKKKDYKFTLIDENDLSEADKELVNLLFEKVGKDKEFTITQLKKYSGSLSTGGTFISQYNKWSKVVTKKGKDQDFFKSKVALGVTTGILTFINFCVMVGAGASGVDSVFPYLPFLISIFMIVICACTIRYSSKGALHLKKWNAFKNFLKDFGTFDVKELPEIHLWERYLVYATIFGLAKQVQNDMNIKIKEIPGYDSTTTYQGDVFTHLYIHNAIANSISKAYTDGKRTYYANRANAYSSSSSGGGFGGGGSFGGGFGGGGGGRGGF